MGSLREAVIIVLVASFMSLGLRAGAVVALCIPLVLAGTFCFMNMLGIDLHKVSLMVKWIDKKTFKAKTLIVNKNK